MPINESWLEQVTEPVFEPDLPIVDPHHHLWDYPGSRYLLDELLADTGSGHRVVATVFVDCRSMYRTDGPDLLKPVGETEFVNRIADEAARRGGAGNMICAGIVGHADMTLGASVDEVLEAHMVAAPSRFRGIRHAVGWDASDEVRNSHTGPSPGLFLDATFQAGVARLGRYGLSFDAWLYHPQLPDVVALARSCPDVTIILDHFGGPLGIGPYRDKRGEVYQRWQRDIADAAACPNVVAKLGGINMAINGFGWHKQERPPTSEALVAATRDYYLHAIDCFGPHRCMFESNFPVDKVSCSYRVLWNAFKRLSAGFSDREKAALFHDTAQRTYRLADARNG